MSSRSPLQLIAGQGLLTNTALALDQDLTAAIARYRSTPLISSFAAVLSNPDALVIIPEWYDYLLTFTSFTCPPLSDSTPVAQASALGQLLFGNPLDGNSVNGFTSLVIAAGNRYLGSGDNSIFVQLFTGVDGFVNATNEYILSVNNSDNYFGSSFTTMNSLITGNLDQVNLAFKAFGTDLKNLGEAIALDNLNNLGSPLALLQQISAVAGLTPRLLQELDLLNIDPNVVFEPPVLLAPTLLLEKVLYLTYQEITGDDLNQILSLLNVTTPGISSLADLLNPVKLFPNSFYSLTVRTPDGLRGIYLDRTGSVNFKLLDGLPSYVLEEFQLLSQIIPPDQALANQCLRISFQQIKNIFEVALPVLAESYLNLTTTKDLTQVNALTTAVPQSTVNFYNATLANGSGPQNTLILGDLIGAAAGIGYTDRILNTVSIFDSVSSDPNFANLVITYQRMDNTLSGVYGDAVIGPVIIPSGPARGIYTATYANTTDTPEGGGSPVTTEVLVESAGANAFGNGLIPNAESFVSSFLSTNPGLASILNANWSGMAQKILNEDSRIRSASIVIEDLIPNQREAVLSFAQNLTAYGTDNDANGAAQYLNQVSNKSSLGGQAIIGALRQGKNEAILSTAGVLTDLDIPAVYQEAPAQANTAIVDYTESEAANLVIR
jgi:hypothetical protein